MIVTAWLSNNYIEVFGAITGILYVFLEIRQNIWLWPVGIITSAVYIWVFFTGKLYADMSLQVYYLIISCLGWYWWVKGTGHRAQGEEFKAQGTGHRAQGEERRAQDTGHRAQGEELRAQGTGGNEAKIKEVEDGRGGDGEKKDGETGRQGDWEKKQLNVTRLKFRTGIVLAFVFIILFSVMWLVLTRLTDSPVPVRDSFITSLSIIATWMLARKIYEHWYLWIVVNSVSVALFLARGLYPTVILYLVYGMMSFAGLMAWRKTIRSG